MSSKNNQPSMLSTLAEDSSTKSFNVDHSGGGADDQIEDLRMQFRKELLSSFRVAMKDSKYGKMCASSRNNNQTVEVEATGGFAAAEDEEERRSAKQVLNRLRLFGK